MGSTVLQSEGCFQFVLQSTRDLDRYDQEDVIYTKKLDPIRVADLSAEQRPEIEETPPVVLGKMKKSHRRRSGYIGWRPSQCASDNPCRMLI